MSAICGCGDEEHIEPGSGRKCPEAERWNSAGGRIARKYFSDAQLIVREELAKEINAALQAEASARASAEAAGREYIERTDPLVSCGYWEADKGTPGEPCGTCRMCAIEARASAEKERDLAVLGWRAKEREVAEITRQREDARHFVKWVAQGWEAFTAERAFALIVARAKELDARALPSAPPAYHSVPDTPRDEKER